MQPSNTSRVSDFGEFVLEIDKLIEADRASLKLSSRNDSRSSVPAKSINSHASISSAGLPIATNFRDNRPQPTFWQQSPPPQTVVDDSETTCGENPNDTRQLRLFKTRFCSYGADCPYMAKGRCLYAHSKDEIRLRPPPPTKLKMSIRQVLLAPTLCNDSVLTSAPDQSPCGSQDSVWTLPDSWDNCTDSVPSTEQLSSLFDCLDQPLSSARTTLASNSSIVLNPSFNC